MSQSPKPRPTPEELRADIERPERITEQYKPRDHAKWRRGLQNKPKKEVRQGDVYFSIPAAFNYCPLPDAHRRCEDDMHFLLACIANRHLIEGLPQNEYVPLQATILRRYIDPRYQAPINEMLKRQGVIECDNEKQIGKKAYGYRFAPAYCGKSKQVECRSDTLANKIIQWHIDPASMRKGVGGNPKKERSKKRTPATTERAITVKVNGLLRHIDVGV